MKTLGFYFRFNPYAFLSALFMALGFPPFGLWILIVPAVGAFVLGLRKAHENPTSLATQYSRLVFQYTLFVNVFGFYWLSYTLKEFGGLPWAVSVPLMILIFLGHTVLPLALFRLSAFFYTKYLLSRKSVLVDNLYFFVLIFLWDVLDFRIFPWSPVQGLGSSREILASVFVLKTLGWRVICFSTAVVWAWTFCSSNVWTRRRGALLFFVPWIVGAPLGLWVIQHFEKKLPERQNVVLIQGNIGNNEKKISKLGILPTIRNVVDIHDSLISQIEDKVNSHDSVWGKDSNNEIWTFWPETSYPLYPTNRNSDAEFLFGASKRTRGPHFVGTYEKAPTLFGGQEKILDFNISAAFDSKAGFLGRYQKMIRVYFGEYVPGDDFWPGVYNLLPQVPHFGKGTEFSGIYHPEKTGPVFVSLICYEILYRGFVKDFLASIRRELGEKGEIRDLILVNPTNDSWYGRTSEPYQHSLLARWNVSEMGLPMLRATNTGFSQVISPWGEVLAEGPQDEMLVIYGQLPVSKSMPRRF
jgi:apolipoprotein N-acyltransferase